MSVTDELRQIAVGNRQSEQHNQCAVRLRAAIFVVGSEKIMSDSVYQQGNASLNNASDQFSDNPFPLFQQMRAIGPIVPMPSSYGTTMWMITRMDEGIQVLKDAQRFTVDPRTVAVDDPKKRRSMDQMATGGFFGGPSMLDVDEPDHARLRTLVSKAFTPRYIEGLRPRIQSLADELLDQVQDQGEIDLVSDFAYPLPINVICDILGVPPNERDQIGYSSYLDRLVRNKRATPQDDLISQLVRIEEEGDRLSEAELRGMVGLLIFAGHETTSNLIGNGTVALLDNPDQMARLKADPSLIASAVEELLRYSAPVVTPIPRFAREDVQIGGQTIHKGDVVLVAIASANRDEGQFDDPEELDLARQVNKHIAFGQGIHYCLGAPLARLEGQIAFTTLLRRMPNLRLNVPRSHLVWRGGMNLRGLVSLPVAF